MGIGGEHHAKGRQHAVELGIVEREILGIGDAGFEAQAVGLGSTLGALEQPLDVVAGRDLGTAACRSQRGVPVAGRHVEHPPAGGDVHRLAQRLADDFQCGADHGVVAGCPRDLLRLLDRLEGVEA